MDRSLNITLDAPLPAISTAISEAGGRPVLVGGYVRDAILGIVSKDADIEIYGLSLEDVIAILERFGDVQQIGRAFGVLQVKGVGADFSLPRKDSKVGQGHKGFDVTYSPDMTFEEAVRRRDVTINTIGYDLGTGAVLDPLGGEQDLEARVLRAADPAHFSDDPLRGLRVAQFAARFEMTVDDELEGLCRKLDLSELSAERIYGELTKTLLKAKRPSLAFEFLRKTNLLRFLPEIEALVDVPQDPEWHPEGDVFIHTMMVIDEAARLVSRDDGPDLAVLMGALCHDLGKPATTEFLDGRLRSHRHDVVGADITRAFLERLRASTELTNEVCALVRHHLAPGIYYRNGATPKAYRKLARELGLAGTTTDQLLKVATADHFGRTTPDALAREFPAGEHFREEIERLSIPPTGPPDVVLGRHLIARGLEPGAHFGGILDRCRAVQDETGWDEPEKILDRVLGSADDETTG